MKKIVFNILLVLFSINSFGQTLKEQYDEARDFAYSSSGLNMTRSESEDFAKEFIKNRGIISKHKD